MISVQAIVASFELRNPRESRPIEITQLLFQSASKRPWATQPNWPPHVTGDEMVAAMDKVGVDGAIFISAFSQYRYDASYAMEVARAHPTRMAIVKPVDPDDPAVAEVTRGWPKTRIVFMSGFTEISSVRHGRLDEGALLLSKPFRKADLARMIRHALDVAPLPADLAPAA